MRLRSIFPVIPVFLAAACGGDSPSEVICRTAAAAPLRLAMQPSEYAAAFSAASAEFGVPAEILAAIAYTETRFHMVEGHDEHGMPAAFGILALRGERLERGARLSGSAVAAVKTDALANVRAAAALLDAYATEHHIDRGTPDAWQPVIEQFSGIELPIGRSAYYRDVAKVLFQNRAPAQRPSLAPPECPKPPDTPPVIPPVVTAPDFSSAVWRPSPNFNSRQGGEGGVIQMVIVHTCEGAYSGCWSWLMNQASGVSAHYVVNEDGSEITQLVPEALRAWHIGATYACSLNRMQKCNLTGVQSNHFTIGVEHGGYASQTSFPDAQLTTSARLVCDITRDNNIPRDWQHVVAHGQLQPQNRTDPGPNWPWISYVHRVQKHCGETLVDDESAYSDADVARSVAASGWFVSDSTAGYYGAGYRWASTTATSSEPHRFMVRTEAAGSRTIDARWTSGTNRSAAAVYRVISAAGDTVLTKAVDQRTGGNTWHALGTVTLPSGWHRVELSREGPLGAVVVADAVRLR